MRSRFYSLLFLGVWFFQLAVIVDHHQAQAHEIRPAYLELTEISPGQFDLLWKQPMRQGMALKLTPILPDSCQQLTMQHAETTPDALTTRWRVDCGPESINGKEISIAGLSRTITNVLVRIQYKDGKLISELLAANRVSFVIFQKKQRAPWEYLFLGIEHLLTGFDHILFVIGLMFLVKRPILIIKTITAFTIAHSITLGLSALDLVYLPQSSVEAVIALSILFLAFELTRKGPHKSVTSRYPWLIAFVFGLLHGFGFAGALTDIGLPKSAVISALFLFNVGVELGQLLIVTGIMVAVFITKHINFQMPFYVARAPIYGMGVISAYWLIERILP
jgi:hypothetical protein